MSQEGGGATQSTGNEAGAELDFFNLVRAGLSWSGKEQNRCFLNTRGGRFANVSPLSGLDFPDDGRGVAQVDWDMDGKLDLVFTNRTAPRVRILHNNAPGEFDFIAMRLQGTTSNRDAIGARVEVHLEGESTPIIKTVRAGDAYASQSSKWIHVGLGKAATIREVIVKWPGGKPESFGPLAVNSRYALVEGGQTAKPWQRPGGNIDLAALPTPEVATEKRALRTFLNYQAPLPRLSYRSFEGNTAAIASEKPMLVVLWATWCPVCNVELMELARASDEIDDLGVDILLLSVDGLENGVPDAKAPAEWLRRRRVSFPAGMATSDLIARLQIINDYIFDIHTPLPVPASFLIDRTGSLAAIYKGKMTVAQLTGDVALLDADTNERRIASVPFAGRQHIALKRASLIPLVSAFADAGYVKEATEIIRRNPDGSQVASLNALLSSLLGRGNSPEALAALDETINEIMASNPGPRELAQLGVARARAGKAMEAATLFQRSLELEPDNAAVLTYLGMSFRDMNLLDAAEQKFAAAIEADPNHAAAYYHLGVLKESRRYYRDAIASYRRLNELMPTQHETARRLAWLLATAPDPALRDGASAVDLARGAMADPNARDYVKLDVLAAAHAAAEQYQEASETAQRAYDAALSDNNTSRARQIQQRIRQYEAGQPMLLPRRARSEGP